MARDLILGTAGHIDHGKTSLVKALTGIDCDRLPEEKARGITIDIGFASLDLGDFRLGIVDVPGHERFIKNMLAGATGIDLVVLIVAADDSIMPQTREHLEILRLLGLRHGVIALTKCDLVDETTREVVELEVRDLVQGTFLENAPLLGTSAQTGDGIAELKAALLDRCRQVEARTGREWFPHEHRPLVHRAGPRDRGHRVGHLGQRARGGRGGMAAARRTRAGTLAPESRSAGRGGASRHAGGDQPGGRPSRGRGARPGSGDAGLPGAVADADSTAPLPGGCQAADQAPRPHSLPHRHGGGHGDAVAAR